MEPNKNKYMFLKKKFCVRFRRGERKSLLYSIVAEILKH